MKKICLTIGCLFLVQAMAFAQVYDDKHAGLAGSMDRAAQQANEYYANVAVPGASEDIVPQDERYKNMTVPMNEANERHFDAGDNAQTVTDKDSAK